MSIRRRKVAQRINQDRERQWSRYRANLDLWQMAKRAIEQIGADEGTPYVNNADAIKAIEGLGSMPVPPTCPEPITEKSI